MKQKQFGVFLLITVLLAAADQLIKYFVVRNIGYQEEKKILGDALVLTYIRNDGTAWGVLGGKQILLIILTVLISAAILYVFMNAAGAKRYRAVRFLLACLFGGAIGNFIDRIRLHYVVDYIYVKLIRFPVFNFADIFVTCSIILLLILFIFYYNGKDFDVMLGDLIYKEDGTYEEKPNGRKNRKTDG